MVKGKDWKRWKEVFSFTFYSIQIWSSLDPSIYSTCTALSPLLFMNYLCPFLFLWKFWPFHLAVKIDRKINEVKETFLLTTFLLVVVPTIFCSFGIWFFLNYTNGYGLLSNYSSPSPLICCPVLRLGTWS